MDIAIIGTGASALLLAQQLVERRCFRSLRVIGPPPAPHSQRLSYWTDEPTPFDPFVETSWKAIALVDGAGRALRLPLQRFAYRTLRARHWLADAWTRVFETPGVEHVPEVVNSAHDRGDAAVVQTARHELEVDWVFSSGRLTDGVPERWQHFMGWELELPRDLPGTDAVTLLDFRTSTDRDFRFCYALPLGPRRLFVEHVAYAPCDHARLLDTYLREVWRLEGWRVVEREAGATPLYRARPARGASRIVPIGVTGGLAKPATGYALLRMWRDARSIATHLQHDARPGRLPHRSLLYRIADDFFLDTLASRPHQLPALLAALFEGVSGDAVLAFLDDRARPRERLAVARAMPAWLSWFALSRPRTPAARRLHSKGT